jgi:putative transposase
MKTGRPKEPIVLTADEREYLEAIQRSRSMPAGIVRRAKIILHSADGLPNADVAKRMDVKPHTVGKWRKRFLTERIQGLHDELRSGRPRSLEDEEVATLINKALQTKPSNATYWSVRSFAKEANVTPSMTHRLFKMFGLQPHRTESFKLSTDPFFIEKVRDVVGLYLNPPDSALVLSVDEKSQIQALNRTQPVLPMGLGYVEGITHDYVRHGTTTLFAALDVASGNVITQCKPRHRHQEFLSFLRHIDANVPTDLDIHLIIDNYATHKHAKVRTWLASHSRYHVHYTPTYASWLNQVERWFGLITQQAIRRSSFRSVKELIRNIQKFVDHYNEKATPFAWTATADSIFAKLKRLMLVINGTAH